MAPRKDQKDRKDRKDGVAGAGGARGRPCGGARGARGGPESRVGSLMKAWSGRRRDLFFSPERGLPRAAGVARGSDNTGTDKTAYTRE